MGNKNQPIAIKPYTMGELCSIYQVTNKTMNTWLRPHSEVIGKREGRYFTALQVEIIFEKIGLPKQLNETA